MSGLVISAGGLAVKSGRLLLADGVPACCCGGGPTCLCSTTSQYHDCGWSQEVQRCCPCYPEWDMVLEAQARYVRRTSGSLVGPGNCSFTSPPEPERTWTLNVVHHLKRRCGPNGYAVFDWTGTRVTINDRYATVVADSEGRQRFVFEEDRQEITDAEWRDGFRFGCAVQAPWSVIARPSLRHSQQLSNLFGTIRSCGGIAALGGPGGSPNTWSGSVSFIAEVAATAAGCGIVAATGLGTSGSFEGRYSQSCNAGSLMERASSLHLVNESNIRIEQSWEASASWSYSRLGVCQTNPCEDQVYGACCVGDSPFGLDQDCFFTTRAGCRDFGGIFRGEGTTCADANCPPRHACCLPNGQCLELTLFECQSRSGIWWNGLRCWGTNCEENVGSCCLPGGGCVEVSPGICAGLGGTFNGPGTLCGVANCAPPTEFGGCCLPNGQCFNDVTHAACLAKGGRWTRDVPCTPGNCVPVVPPTPPDRGLIPPGTSRPGGGCGSCGDGGF